MNYIRCVLRFTYRYFTSSVMNTAYNVFSIDFESSKTTFLYLGI